MPNSAPADHRIHELLKQRWSPRAFAETPVRPEQLQRLLEAARWAPSSYNDQPWAFLIATREEPENYERLLGVLAEFNQSWAKSAPLLGLAVARLNLERDGQPNRHACYDVGQAVAHLTVQATAERLAVHQMAGFSVDGARREFSIPAGWEPITAFAIGYPGDPKSLPDSLRQRELAPRKRKPLETFVFSSRWGNSSPVISSS
jgi:nitroreductase